MNIATERFAENAKRIERFLNAFRPRFTQQGIQVKRNPDGEEWEDAAARRERKRAEGLRRKAELEEKKKNTTESSGEQDKLDPRGEASLSIGT